MHVPAFTLVKYQAVGAYRYLDLHLYPPIQHSCQVSPSKNGMEWEKSMSAARGDPRIATFMLVKYQVVGAEVSRY